MSIGKWKIRGGALKKIKDAIGGGVIGLLNTSGVREDKPLTEALTHRRRLSLRRPRKQRNSKQMNY